MNEKIKMDLHIGDYELIAKAGRIAADMEGNEHFPGPTVNLAELVAKVEQMDMLKKDISRGNHLATQEKKTLRKAIQKMLSSLGSYVESVALGNGDIIKSSGFDLRKESTPVGRVANPENLKVNHSGISGMVDLKWNKVANARNYVVHYAAVGEELQWQEAVICSGSRASISNLIKAEEYLFRVAAIGTKGRGGFSEPVSTVAQ